jgi:nicotinamidase-related amidase
LQDSFRANGIDVIHARIACLLEDGRDRSLSQKMPGWNNLLMPLTSEASQIIPELARPPARSSSPRPPTAR